MTQPHRATITCPIMDITTSDCDIIVNAANRSLLGGGGVDGAIHKAAGPGLLGECGRCRVQDYATEDDVTRCHTGGVVLTAGHDLPSRFIIHTVGPVYADHSEDEAAELLYQCYLNSLDLAEIIGVRSIAFPAISTGIYGYPLKEAIQIAVEVAMLHRGTNVERIVLTCFDEATQTEYANAILDLQDEFKQALNVFSSGW